MNNWSRLLIAGVFSIMTQTVSAASLEMVWEVSGFKMPESVVFDKKRHRYYVSNVNQSPLNEDHNGSIGYISADGSEKVIDWIDGLSSPKGLDIKDDYLYVADVKELVVINLATHAISARYPAPNATVLNGITIIDDTVYISDWLGNALYKLEEHGIKPWLSSDELENPNGLFAKGEYIYISAWGANMRNDFTTETSGGLKRIHIKSKKLESVNSGDTWMNLDGIHAAHDTHWLTTDFIKGELLLFNQQGKIKDTIKLDAPSSADFYYNEKEGLIIVPYLLGDKVIAYKYK